MGRKSTIDRLDLRIRTAVDQAIEERRATGDEIAVMIERMGKELGTGDTASRSAVYRYKANFEEMLPAFRASQEMNKVLAESLKNDPQGDAARLARHVLGAITVNTVNGMLASGEAVPADEIALLSRALTNMARTDVITEERVARARREERELAANDAAAAADKTGKQTGVSPEQSAAIRAAIQQIVG